MEILKCDFKNKFQKNSGFKIKSEVELTIKLAMG